MKKNYSVYSSKGKKPAFLRSILWSYDLNKVDLREDKKGIITQVLNYGDWKALKWLYSFYGEKEIKDVVSHPIKGLWFDKVLNFWQKMLDVALSSALKKKAIFRIEPVFK
jgi:hypothetical protein